jgi:predicted nucleic acid-binding protein
MSETVWLFDTNVLVYARDPRHTDKQQAALSWLARARDLGILAVCPQVVGEFANVLSRREFGYSIEHIGNVVEDLAAYSRSGTTTPILREAARLRVSTGFQWWDCIILANAIDCGASHLISEDYSHRYAIDGVIIINPFLEMPDALFTSSAST